MRQGIVCSCLVMRFSFVRWTEERKGINRMTLSIYSQTCQTVKHYHPNYWQLSEQLPDTPSTSSHIFSSATQSSLSQPLPSTSFTPNLCNSANALASTPWKMPYTTTILGTSASTGECSPKAPAWVDGSTVIVKGLSKNLFEMSYVVSQIAWTWESRAFWFVVRACLCHGGGGMM